MRGALGPVAVRTLVKVGFKDRFQNKLYRSLDHSILDGGNSQPTGLAVSLGYLYPPILARLVRSCDKFPSNLREELLYALGFDGLKTFSINTRRPIVGFCFLIRRC